MFMFCTWTFQLNCIQWVFGTVAVLGNEMSLLLVVNRLKEEEQAEQSVGRGREIWLVWWIHPRTWICYCLQEDPTLSAHHAAFPLLLPEVTIPTTACCSFFRRQWCFHRLPTHCRRTGGTPPVLSEACWSHLSLLLCKYLFTIRSRVL